MGTKNISRGSKNINFLREYPVALREYISTSEDHFDEEVRFRNRDQYLHLFNYVKYDINDRDFGGRNMNMCNIFYNRSKDDMIDELIEDMLYKKQWIFYPVKTHDSWANISLKFYNDVEYYWVPIVFNKIIDPFKALEEFNMIRIPHRRFIEHIPTRWKFRYDHTDI